MWVVARYRNYGLHSIYDWLYDELSVRWDGSYSIVVADDGKHKTYQGKLSKQRLDKLRDIINEISSWSKTLTPEIWGSMNNVCDGTHWDLKVERFGKKIVDIDWQIPLESNSLASFEEFYRTMKHNAKLVKTETNDHPVL